jgi:hypothetical protein
MRSHVSRLAGSACAMIAVPTSPMRLLLRRSHRRPLAGRAAASAAAPATPMWLSPTYSSATLLSGSAAAIASMPASPMRFLLRYSSRMEVEGSAAAMAMAPASPMALPSRSKRLIEVGLARSARAIAVAPAAPRPWWCTISCWVAPAAMSWSAAVVFVTGAWQLADPEPSPPPAAAAAATAAAAAAAAAAAPAAAAAALILITIDITSIIILRRVENYDRPVAVYVVGERRVGLTLVAPAAAASKMATIVVESVFRGRIDHKLIDLLGCVAHHLVRACTSQGLDGGGHGGRGHRGGSPCRPSGDSGDWDGSVRSVTVRQHLDLLAVRVRCKHSGKLLVDLEPIGLAHGAVGQSGQSGSR